MVSLETKCTQITKQNQQVLLICLCIHVCIYACTNKKKRKIGYHFECKGNTEEVRGKGFEKDWKERVEGKSDIIIFH